MKEFVHIEQIEQMIGGRVFFIHMNIYIFMDLYEKNGGLKLLQHFKWMKGFIINFRHTTYFGGFIF